MRRNVALMAIVGLLVLSSNAAAQIDRAAAWAAEWPNTDFTRHSEPLSEIESNLAKDSIASIDDPKFLSASDVLVEEEGRTVFPPRKGSYSRSMSGDTFSLSPQDPVISFEINGDARAYPLRIMIFHEIVNDVVGGEPVAVTYCPLCNTAIVFKRTLDGEAVEFGTTGKLRHSDLVMYDRKTHSWWQQFTGKAIVGELTGHRLERLAARLESYEHFSRRHPGGRVMAPPRESTAPYGKNPYFQYDSARRPFLYRGKTPAGIDPLARVVAVDGTAYDLALVQKERMIEEAGLRISWVAGQASALDARNIADGRDVGTVVVQRMLLDGTWRDVPYDVTFAFAFHAFETEGRWRLLDDSAATD